MSAQNSSGIQTLLEAERKAHEIVQASRAFRTQRLKAAKVDAAKEIEAYKKEKEVEFKEYESQHTGSTTKAEQEAELEVKAELEDIKKKSKASEDSVVKTLIGAITTPAPSLHINA